MPKIATHIAVPESMRPEVERTNEPNPKGIRKPQLRILKILARAKAPLNRYMISERSDVPVSNIHGSLIRRSAHPDYPALCEMGWAKGREMDVDGGTETVWVITAKGRRMLETIREAIDD